MIIVYISNDSAMLMVEAGFSTGKVFYITYQNGQFYCQPKNPGFEGKPFYISGLDEDNILARALSAQVGDSCKKNNTYSVSKIPVESGVKDVKAPQIIKIKPEYSLNSNFDPKKYFKGTTFGGVTENAFGFIAALLKEGLGNSEVHIGVKLKWTAGDLLKYIEAIKEKTELNVQVV